VGVSVNGLVWTLRVVVLVLPPVVGLVVHRTCRALAAGDEQAAAAAEELAVDEASPRRRVSVRR
jgi:hypothetical protein